MQGRKLRKVAVFFGLGDGRIDDEIFAGNMARASNPRRRAEGVRRCEEIRINAEGAEGAEFAEKSGEREKQIPPREGRPSRNTLRASGFGMTGCGVRAGA